MYVYPLKICPFQNRLLYCRFHQAHKYVLPFHQLKKYMKIYCPVLCQLNQYYSTSYRYRILQYTYIFTDKKTDSSVN